MLILFDIDATMISTSGAGMLAMLDAGKELFGPSFSIEGVAAAGRLDPLIMDDLFRAHGVETTQETWMAFRGAYRRRLEERLRDPAAVSRALPGVIALLDDLAARPELCLGVLTGNFADTGAIKLRACGIDPDRFHLHVWGDESTSTPPRREDLPGVAIGRYLGVRGSEITGERVVVIGDTPHDIRCAQAHGCRSLGVATGSFSIADLRACGATHAVGDLSDTAGVVKWLLGRA